METERDSDAWSREWAAVERGVQGQAFDPENRGAGGGAQQAETIW